MEKKIGLNLKWKILFGILAGIILCISIYANVGDIPDNSGSSSTNPSPTTKKITASPYGKKVDAPVTLPDYVTSLTLFDSNSEPNSNGIDYYLPNANTFNLTNKNIAAKINNTIRKQADSAISTYPLTYLNTWHSAYNGFATVAFYSNAPSTIPYMNFDLHTGELFDLRAVFADNVDAEYELNRYVSLWLLSLEDSSRSYRFKGVSMSTPFALNTNTLTLFFDKSTPALQDLTLEIPFVSLGNNGDVVAIFSRFPMLSDSDLTNSTNNYLLYDKLQKSRYITKTNNTANYNAEVPLDYESNAIKATFDSYLTRFNNEYKTYDYPYEPVLTYKQFGDLYVIDYNAVIKNTREYISEHVVYNGKTGKKVELPDLFKSGFDYKAQFRYAIEKDCGFLITDAELEAILGNLKWEFYPATIYFTFDNPRLSWKTNRSAWVYFKDFGVANIKLR
ncbi:hypothetical protein FACS189425_08330 [Clostridia bacterium]|nr:hypothetical protein FACS189425_08330 [Clostridia bacterium]